MRVDCYLGGDEYSLVTTQRFRSFSNTLFELLRLLQRMADKRLGRLGDYALAMAAASRIIPMSLI